MAHRRPLFRVEKRGGERIAREVVDLLREKPRARLPRLRRSQWPELQSTVQRQRPPGTAPAQRSRGPREKALEVNAPMKANLVLLMLLGRIHAHYLTRCSHERPSY